MRAVTAPPETVAVAVAPLPGVPAPGPVPDPVIVTVGAGGAFPSGTAELTPAARKIMSNIAEVNKKGNSTIKVTGHTDNVPLVFGTMIIVCIPLMLLLVVIRFF